MPQVRQKLTHKGLLDARGTREAKQWVEKLRSSIRARTPVRTGRLKREILEVHRVSGDQITGITPTPYASYVQRRVQNHKIPDSAIKELTSIYANSVSRRIASQLDRSINLGGLIQLSAKVAQ